MLFYNMWWGLRICLWDIYLSRKKLTEKLGRKDIRNIKEKLCDYGHPFEKIICISYYNDNTLEIEFLSNLLKTDNKNIMRFLYHILNIH